MAKSSTTSKPPSKPTPSQKPGAKSAAPGAATTKPPPSSAPPSSIAAGTGGGGGSGYAIGAVVLGVAAAFLLYKKCSEPDTAPTPTTQTTTTVKAPVPEPLPEFSPPPPPEEEPDAGPDAGKPVSVAKSEGKGTPSEGGGVCAGCGQGEASSALTTAVSGTAGLARGCYQRALRTGGGEGRIMVSVSVGADGNLCGARITSDTVGNPAISSCVLSKFQKSYPKPTKGCVVVNVPINFKMKTEPGE